MSRIAKLNEAQLTAKDSESWHADYKDSAYIYAGGLSYELTEGDIVCIFSQYGEILDVNLIRDKNTGASKGFCFLRYEDQRSTILAVDNLSGAKVLGRSLRVDHVNQYKQPKRAGEDGAEDWDQDPRASMNVAPVALFSSHEQSVEHPEQQKELLDDSLTAGIDPEDPMFEYLVNERREAAKQANSQSDDKRNKEHRSSKHRSRKSSRDRRHRSRDRYSSRERSERHRRRDS